MPSTISVAGLMADTGKVLDVMTANPDFTLGTVTKDAINAAAQDLKTAHEAVESKRTELTGLMDTRDDKAEKLQDLISRTRSGIRAVFGPDSAQYEQAGCTRKSERKSRRRTVAASSLTTASAN